MRDRILCEYSGIDDPMWYARTPYEPTTLVSACKKYLAESRKDIAIVGIPPFCVGNPALEVC